MHEVLTAEAVEFNKRILQSDFSDNCVISMTEHTNVSVSVSCD